MQNKLNSETPTLWIKFYGSSLDVNSIPIYDLAEVLTAIQRIINKMYLFNKNQLLKGHRLKNDEKNSLSLQLSKHEKGSDLYGLTTFLSEPFVSEIVIPLLLDGLVALGAYAVRKVVKKRKTNDHNNQKENENLQNNINPQMPPGLIYPQVSGIVTRIGQKSEINIIEIFTDADNQIPIRFNSKIKEYVKNIKDEYFLGVDQVISGKIRSLHIPTKTAVIRRSQNNFVKVRLNDNDFRDIRYEAHGGPTITFSGQPRYKFGIETIEFSEFEAYSVIIREK